MEKLLTELRPGEEGKIKALGGGHRMQERLRSLGIVEGHLIRKLSNLAWSGPVIVLVNRAQIAIGFGMASRIIIQTDGNNAT